MESKPFTLRWGILATGGIAKTFSKDLLIPPSTRAVSNITHTITAAASSTSLSRAQSFLSEISAPQSAKAYSSYIDLIADENVDIIYVASPHSHHYQHARLCLSAGKHVLCEKAFTVNAAQASILVDIARENGVFLMEAVWTRFFPLVKQIRDVVGSGKIGEVKRVWADLSFCNDVETTFGVGHRMVNLGLAGGALLDLGIYSLTWIFQILYHIVPDSERGEPRISSQITKYPRTGCDEMTTVLLNFPSGAHGIATTSLRVPNTTPAVHIQGTLGSITIPHPCYRPTSYTLTSHSSSASEPETVTHDVPGGGYGMFWEADECARCIRDGKQESDIMPWNESLVIMRVMDSVRENGGLRYPEALESCEWPLEF